MSGCQDVNVSGDFYYVRMSGRQDGQDVRTSGWSGCKDVRTVRTSRDVRTSGDVRMSGMSGDVRMSGMSGCQDGQDVRRLLLCQDVGDVRTSGRSGCQDVKRCHCQDVREGRRDVRTVKMSGWPGCQDVRRCQDVWVSGRQGMSGRPGMSGYVYKDRTSEKLPRSL